MGKAANRGRELRVSHHSSGLIFFPLFTTISNSPSLQAQVELNRSAWDKEFTV